MGPREPRRTEVRPDADRHAPLLVALGALAAVVLVIVALADLGDPVEAARGRLERDAAAHGRALELAWERRLTSAALPIEGNDHAIALGREPMRFGGGGIMPGSPPSRLADVLAAAALAEAAAGRLDEATRLVNEGLERNPSPSQRAAMRLHLARWAAALGHSGDVALQRAAFASEELEGHQLDGTSIELLLALVSPVDPAQATSALNGEAPALPLPKDRAWIGPEGHLHLAWDPWWETIEARLAGAMDEGPRAALFRREERTREALRPLLGPWESIPAGRWGTVGEAAPGGVLLARRDGEQASAICVPFSATEAAIRGEFAALGPTFGNPPRPFRLDPAPGAGDVEPVVGPPLVLEAAGPVALRLHLRDPLREGFAERRRMGILRGALLALAGAILGATLLGARSMGRARRLAALRSTFVASVSHDLRTPIQSVLLMAETLERGRVATEQGRARYFTSIRQEALRLRRFVEDLLDGARIDRGEGPQIQREWTDAEAFMEGLETALRERAEGGGATLSVSRSSLPPQLHLDAMGIERALFNLVENALRYGRSKDGQVHVRVDIRAARGVLAFTVEDDGPGIPARHAETIFDPFERAAEDGKGHGTGLGLAIVRAISRAHGGDVRHETTPSSGGARFVATFRALPPDDPNIDPDPDSEKESA